MICAMQSRKPSPSRARPPKCDQFRDLVTSPSAFTATIAPTTKPLSATVMLADPNARFHRRLHAEHLAYCGARTRADVTLTRRSA